MSNFAGMVMRRVAMALLWGLLSIPAAADSSYAADFRLLRLEGHYVKWGAAQFGTGARVSYAILRGERRDANAINCRAMAGLGDLLAYAEIDEATFRTELRAALVMWQAAADISFVRADNAAEADIVFGAQLRPRGIAYTNIDFASASHGEFNVLRQATVCLNPRIAWNRASDAGARVYTLRQVLAHEVGHAIGFDHPGRHGQLMAYAYQSDVKALTADDIAGAIMLYGRRAPDVLPLATISYDVQETRR